NAHFWRLSLKNKNAHIIDHITHKHFSYAVLTGNDTTIHASFLHDNISWEHSQFAVEYTKAYIESECGYVIQGMRTIQSYSIIAKNRLPSVLSYVKKRVKKSITINEALMFDCVL